MMAYIILHSPQKHERRHKQDCAPIGPEHSAHFAQTGNIIIEMLHDIKSGNQIERGIWERQALSRALLYFSQASGATEIERVGRDVNSFGGAELRQHLEIGAGATPYIENSRPLLSEVTANPVDKSRDDAPAAREPPVFSLDLVHDRVSVLLHLARERAANIISGGGHKLLRGFAA
jgi:hypothetical protein